MNQWNRIDSSEIITYLYGRQLVFDENAKTIQWVKNSLFKKWCWENGLSTCKRMKIFTPTSYRIQNKLKMYQISKCKLRL